MVENEIIQGLGLFIVECLCTYCALDPGFDSQHWEKNLFC